MDFRGRVCLAIIIINIIDAFLASRASLIIERLPGDKLLLLLLRRLLLLLLPLYRSNGYKLWPDVRDLINYRYNARNVPAAERSARRG